MGRSAALSALVLAMLAVPVAVAQVVLAPTVSGRTSLPPGVAKVLVVGCPAGYLAVSGGVSRAGPGLVAVRVAPRGPRAYAFRVGNPAANPTRRVAAVVACRRLRGGSGQEVFLELRQLGPTRLRLPPGALRSATLRCPPSTAPAGWGVDLAPRAPRAARFEGTRLSVRRLILGLRTFSVAVRNSGRSARTVAVSGNCLTVRSRSVLPRESLRVKQTTFRGWVDPGKHGIARSCRRGWVSLATGYAVPAASVEVESSAAVSGGGRWSVANEAATPRRLVLELVCARVES